MQHAAPASPDRIQGIDVARGLALLGILLVNARMFFGTLACALDPSLVPPGLEPTVADAIAWGAVEVFCTYKCMSLFSILFGFGLAMQASRSRGAVPRRLCALIALGVLHGTLVWYGDILTLYGILGFAVFGFASIDPKWTRRAFVTIVVVITLLTVFSASMRMLIASNPEWAAQFTRAPEASAAAAADTSLRGLSAMTGSGFDIGSETWITAETAAYQQGPFVDALLFRAISFGFSLLAAAFGYGWHALAMMLFGLWAFRSGLFAQSDPTASGRRIRIAKVTLPAGLLLAAGSVLPYWFLGLHSTTASVIHKVGIEFAGLVLPLAYAVLLVEYAPKLPRLVAMPLERAGRMSLSVYLAESVVCVTLASWWGLGWFGTMLDARFTLVAVAVWIALVAAAVLWSGRFGTGPLERVWRRLAYG